MCAVYLSFNISGKIERQEEVDKRGGSYFTLLFGLGMLSLPNYLLSQGRPEFERKTQERNTIHRGTSK